MKHKINNSVGMWEHTGVGYIIINTKYCRNMMVE